MITAIGHWFNQKVRKLLYAAGFFYHVVFETVLFPRKRQVGLRVLIMQILFTGVEALGIISLISLLAKEGIVDPPEGAQSNMSLSDFRAYFEAADLPGIANVWTMYSLNREVSK